MAITRALCARVARTFSRSRVHRCFPTDLEDSVKGAVGRVSLANRGMRNSTRYYKACPQTVLGSLRYRHLVVESGDVAGLEPHPGVA